jgi:predicted HD phosphohydrolase
VAPPDIGGSSPAGPPGHLVRRFFSVSFARGLDADEQRWVATLLRPAEVDGFWAQPIADQRHGHDCARWVAERTDRPDLVRAALLHDIGKRHARLGPIGRSVATIAAALGFDGPERFRRYTRHGPEAARELAEAGAEPLVVTFAAHHHGERPDTIAAEAWDLLQRADRLT